MFYQTGRLFYEIILRNFRYQSLQLKSVKAKMSMDLTVNMYFEKITNTLYGKNFSF